jgi:hypothetical protein
VRLVLYTIAFLILKKTMGHQASSRSSSLTNESIHHLETLFQAQKEYPSSKVIATWAVLLKAKHEDVVAWLETRCSPTGLDHPPSPIHHLPTPVSTSPEPQQVTSSTDFESVVKSDPIYSPVVPSFFDNLPHVSHSLPALNFVMLNFLLQDEVLSRDALIHAIAEAASSPRTATVKPTNAAEFNEMFNPYLERINIVIRKNEEHLSRR